MAIDDPSNGSSIPTYSMLGETRSALKILLQVAKSQIPPECVPLVKGVQFATENTGTPVFPCPFKETEATGALKAVEAGIASAIARLFWGEEEKRAVVDLERASCFLFSTYLATVGGFDKANAKAKTLLKDTDLKAAQSNGYRRLSANLYETKETGKYFHLHGSLEATTALKMIGLPGHNPDLTDYRDCINTIESHVKKFTLDELEALNAKHKQAGVSCLKPEEFKATEHGKILTSEPPWTVTSLESSSPPVPFNQTPSQTTKPQILAGIKVLELCRIIAGPSIGKGLAEYGAKVIKVTSPNLSDVPFFQIDVNLGKHTCDLDLKTRSGREAFETLLQDADVVLDGYRPGALERLGYGPKALVELTKHRGKGIVYVAENCFGNKGPWALRPGWQQIADCATGIAWEQGWFMGLDEPVVPPFPMSDYGTGCMGTIAALTGLYKRAKYGGSYSGATSLCQYDIFLLSLGVYEKSLQEELRRVHDPEFFDLRHFDSVDEVGRRSLKTMRKVHPELFDDGSKMSGKGNGAARHRDVTRASYSKGFKTDVRYVCPVVEIEGTWNGWLRQARPNGFDEPTWEGWEVDEDMVKT
ncbi:alpha-methylacyl-CoA racemase [Venturia nashicola]|uniref:Alpha-methylacyl-CoA racemase n=1 Tax=Venturia nashicola TaxID=86259 RepID=A0A4Z1PPW2_9PEZI|nr:alpha-methylacyl-CoA racemase [Venturia nashicola]